MPFIPPDVTTPFEEWDRADGAAHAGAGSTIWNSVDQDGNASTLTVSSNQGACSAEGGARTVRSDTDLCWVVELPTIGGGYLAFFLRWQDTTHWYRFLLLASGGWAISVNNGGGASNLATASSVALTNGDALEVVVSGDLFELYHRTGGVWNETPILTIEDSTITAAGPSSLVLGNTAWRIGDILDVDTSAPMEGVTIYVGGDVDGDDARTRATASNPATPVATLQRAAALAQAGADWHDEIQIVASVDANPADTVDTSVYAEFNHRIDNISGGAPTLSFGDNSGNEPIVVKGGAGVKVRYPPSGRQLKNWRFEDIQFGYDVDSGDDVLGTAVFSHVEDIWFTGCLFTSGGYIVNAWTGELRVVECEIRAPVSENLLPSEGFGFSLGYLSDSGIADDGAGDAYFINSSFINVRGNDAIKAGMGAPDAENARLFVDGCLFHDVTEAEGGADVFHTDSIQSLGGPLFDIRNSAFIGCSNAFIASDFRNDQIIIENNLIVGAGAQITIQGYNLARIRHNTIIPASTFGADSSIMFATRTGGMDFEVQIQDNIFGGIFYLHESARTDQTGVIENNLCLTDPGGSTHLGDHLPGIPEFGTSARMADLPTTAINFPGGLPANYELANTIPNPAIGAGVVTGIATDRLGRAYANPPDVGCHQNDPGTPVTPVARAPYVVARDPASGETDVPADVTATVTFYPKPGEVMDPATLTEATIYITNPAGDHIPAVVSVGSMDVDGNQPVTLDFKAGLTPDVVEGELIESVVYTLHLTDDVADTEGSAITAESWAFRIEDGAGIVAVDEVPVENVEFSMSSVPWAAGTTVSVYLERAMPTGALTPSGPSVTSAAVTSASTVTFSGLTQGIRYVAFADGRAVRFMVPLPVYRTVRVQ